MLDKIKNVIEEVKTADNISKIHNLKKLKGYDSFYRIKFGDYRVGTEIVNNEVIFTRFLHRRKIYRYFP